MKNSTNKIKKGITLTELLVTVFLIGILAYLMPIGVKLLNGIKYQQQMAQTNQQIEAFVSIITQDINNAPDFFKTPSQSSPSLQLYALNLADFPLNQVDGGFPRVYSLNKNTWARVDYELVPLGDAFLIRRTSNVTHSLTTPSSLETHIKDFLYRIVVPPEAGHPLFNLGTDNDSVVLDMGFRYPFQRKTDAPKRFVKRILKWSSVE